MGHLACTQTLPACILHFFTCSIIQTLASSQLAWGCLKNLDPRCQKLRPSGCLKNSDLKSKTYLITLHECCKLTCLLFIDTVTLHALIMKIICWEKKKQFAVLDVCNDHENYTQHSYRFFFLLSYKPSLYPQRVMSLEAIHEVYCMMVSCTNTGLASRNSRGGYLKLHTTFRGPYTSLFLKNNCV